MKTNKTEKLTPASPLAALFEMTDSIWWPHRSAAKACLEAQDNASTCISAYRNMVDQMRDIVRKEQDFAWEMSRKVCKDFAEKGWAAMSDPSAMSAAFAHAMSGTRAFGEAWTNAQQSSFNAMPTHAYENNVKRWSDIVMATGSIGGGDSKRRAAPSRTDARPSHH